MRESKRHAPAFDVGTSPHGLSADLAQTHQETRSPSGLHSLADGFAAVACAEPPQGARHEPQAAESELCRHDRQAAACQATSLTFTFTEEQRNSVAFALLNEITYLEECDEFPDPEILEAIHYLSGARNILQGRPE